MNEIKILGRPFQDQPTTYLLSNNYTIPGETLTDGIDEYKTIDGLYIMYYWELIHEGGWLYTFSEPIPDYEGKILYRGK